MESRRGCGWRKHGGLYLCSDGVGMDCDRLPYPLTTCPTCGEGVKQSRGWQWINAHTLVGGHHQAKINGHTNVCTDPLRCVFCHSTEELSHAGLHWIGERFYKTPKDFITEGRKMGFSRRIKTVPRGFKVGETWVLLAHPKAVPTPESLLEDFSLTDEKKKDDYHPGIFQVWRPSRIEKIFFNGEANSNKIKEARKQGLTPVFVPEDQKHEGTVYDEEEAEDE
jgi:hypothetical protein